MCVKNFVREFIQEQGDHIYYLYKQDGVLPFGQVRLSKEDKDGFNVSCNSLLNSFSVVFIYFGMDGIINNQGLWSKDMLSFSIEDSSSFGARPGFDKPCTFTPKRLVPLKLI